MTYKILNQRNASDGFDVTVLTEAGERITWHWPIGSEPKDVESAVAERVATWAPPCVPEPVAEEPSPVAPSYIVEGPDVVTTVVWAEEPRSLAEGLTAAAQDLRDAAAALGGEG